MVDIIQDTHQFTISIIIHADLSITNVVAPTSVESGTPFDITYDVVNNGSTDTCFGHIIDNSDSSTIVGSRWEDSIDAGETKSVIFTHPGITEDLTSTIEVGYIK